MGFPLSGNIQGQAGWGCEQPGLERGVPAYSRGLELHDLKGPFQPKPFYESIFYMKLTMFCTELPINHFQSIYPDLNKMQNSKQESAFFYFRTADFTLSILHTISSVKLTA